MSWWRHYQPSSRPFWDGGFQTFYFLSPVAILDPKKHSQLHVNIMTQTD